MQQIMFSRKDEDGLKEPPAHFENGGVHTPILHPRNGVSNVWRRPRTNWRRCAGHGLVDSRDVATRQGRVYRLKPAVKQYAWGIRGDASRVSRFALEAGTIQSIDQSAPYAELWLGALRDNGEMSLAASSQVRIPPDPACLMMEPSWQKLWTLRMASCRGYSKF